MKPALYLLFICILFSFLEGQAQPLFQNSATNTGSSSPATVNAPAGINSGDLLVIGFMFEKGSAENITPPDGWNLILRTNNSTDCGLATYYKVAGSSEPASYSFGFDNGSKWCLGISRITGAEQSYPIEVFSGSTGNSGNPNAPSVTTLSNNTLILCYYTNKKNATYTPAATTTERYDAPNAAEGQPSNMMASFVHTSGGTGNLQATASDNTERWVTQQIAIIPSITLPVELVHFNAAQEGSGVQVTWATASEINNSHFTVFRSEDGVTFEELGRVTGNGSTTQPSNYVFQDDAPASGTSYYRLTQTDFNGLQETLKLTAVDFSSVIPEGVLTVFPNPCQGKFTVNLSASAEDESVATLELLNAAGMVVYTAVAERNAQGG
ncbi:MAG TPA: hypothetical protein VI757_01910, partial [Bacteroidia bacterium]|nr:hypothetical protein [Bacteroidia bacterium]